MLFPESSPRDAADPSNFVGRGFTPAFVLQQTAENNQKKWFVVSVPFVAFPLTPKAPGQQQPHYPVGGDFQQSHGPRVSVRSRTTRFLTEYCYFQRGLNPRYERTT